MILSLYQPHFTFCTLQHITRGQILQSFKLGWMAREYLFDVALLLFIPINILIIHPYNTQLFISWKPHYSTWRFILMIGGERKWNHRVSFTVIGLRRKWGIKLSRIVTDWTWFKIWKQKIELITLWLNICGQVFRYVYCLFVCYPCIYLCCIWHNT